MNYTETSEFWAKETLPKRSDDSNKGSYGRLFAYVGSDKFKGAAHLALEAALRGGVGYVEVGASGGLRDSLLLKFPEAIYKDFPSAESMTDEELLRLRDEQRRATATLIGCGSGRSGGLARLITALLEEDGGVLVLDADALNSISDYKDELLAAMQNTVRRVIITPHHMEFSRLTGLDVAYIKANGKTCAESFALKYNCTVVLKGNRTVITDGKQTLINTSGSSALAKAGSGDTLAGLLAALAATKIAPPVIVSALAAYIHGKAGDNLADEYSEYGVTPSDLPKEMARVMRELEK